MSISRRAFLLGRRHEPEVAVVSPVAQVAKIQEHCLALQSVVCRTCGEMCDLGAIRFPPRLGGVAQPVLDADACTGCGDCLPDCPTQALQLVAVESQISSSLAQGAA